MANAKVFRIMGYGHTQLEPEARQPQEIIADLVVREGVDIAIHIPVIPTGKGVVVLKNVLVLAYKAGIRRFRISYAEFPEEFWKERGLPPIPSFHDARKEVIAEIEAVVAKVSAKAAVEYIKPEEGRTGGDRSNAPSSGREEATSWQNRVRRIAKAAEA